MPLHFWEQCGHKRSVELPAGDAFFVWVDLLAGLMALVGTSASGLALGGATVGALVGTSASGLALGGAPAWALGRASASGLALGGASALAPGCASACAVVSQHCLLRCSYTLVRITRLLFEVSVAGASMPFDVHQSAIALSVAILAQGKALQACDGISQNIGMNM